MEKYDGISKAADDDITRRMPFTCWLNKVTDVRTEYINFPQQKLLREHTSILHLYEHFLPSYYC
jgi:hypothetical protein